MRRLRLHGKSIKLSRQPCLCPKVGLCEQHWYISAVAEGGEGSAHKTTSSILQYLL